MLTPKKLLFLLPLALGLAVAALPETRGADAEKDARFESADQVDLRGNFYPPSKGNAKEAPTVLILHEIGGNSQQDGWDKLAKELQKIGCAVLTFDFRGHGESTAVTPDFWRLAQNIQGHTGGINLAKPKETISIKDFNKGYYPMLVNDIVAARMFLDRKNDEGLCNSGNLIVIGAGEGATLGLMWMATEWARKSAPVRAGIIAGNIDPGSMGKQLSAGIWLSISPRLGSRNPPVNTWLKLVGLDNKVPMCFLYGAEDRTGSTYSKQCLQALKPDTKNKPFTRDRAIPKTSLTGHKLLGDTLQTRSDIVKYVEALIKENKGQDWDRRNIKETGFVWQFPNRLPIIAKAEMQATYNPFLPSYLGMP